MVLFIFIQILIEHCGNPDQMACYAESGLGLHCLPMSHKKDARLIWVKHNLFSCIKIALFKLKD